MNTLARRWAPHVCVLLGITMLPVVLHGYVGVESDDCAHATAIAPLWAPGDAPTGHAAYIDERMKPEQWREGILRESDGTALSYAIGRGFDAKHLIEVALAHCRLPRLHGSSDLVGPKPGPTATGVFPEGLCSAQAARCQGPPWRC